MAAKRWVPCDDAFWSAYERATSYRLLDKEFEHVLDALYGVVDFLFYAGGVRFTISIFSLLPYAACIAIGFSKKANNFRLRLFCWNGTIINGICTVFLAAKLIVEELVLPDDVCYYDATNVPGVVMADIGPIGAFACPFMLEDVTKWVVYATAMTVTYVHFGTYRACTSPLSFSKRSEGGKMCIVAVISADILAAVIVALESQVYGPEMPYRVRTGLTIATGLAIWACEFVVSSMSVFALLKWKFSQKYAKVTKNVNASRMTSFLLFTIIPGLLLLPFAYINLKNVLEVAREEQDQECIEKYYIFSPSTLYTVAIEDKCGLASASMTNVLTSVLDAVAGVCMILCVWKPILEALSIIFLLPGYRAVVFEKLSVFVKRLDCANRRTVVFVVAPQRNPSITRSRYSA